VQVPQLRRDRGGGDDPRLCCSEWKEKTCQREMTEMVDAEVHLEPILRQLPLGNEDHAGVEDQRRPGSVAIGEHRREFTHRIEGREIEGEKPHLCSRRCAHYRATSAQSAFDIANAENQGTASSREVDGGGMADASGATRHHDGRVASHTRHRPMVSVEDGCAPILDGVNSRRAWTVFGIGVVAYMVAILQRSSLGVAGVEASERFDSTAAALSSLGVLQLVVYAVLQVPVGVLIDRIGPKALIVGGAAFMAVGQAIVALTPDLTGAVVGRVLVGAGDAATFTSVLRLINTWFAGPRVPQLNQWLGNLGQFGQVLSAIPFATMLHVAGWEPAFLSAGATAVLSFVLAIALLSDGHGAATSERAPDLRTALVSLVHSFKRPGTRLGFWAHYITQSPGTVFALFWGYPFMVFGLQLTPVFASAMIAMMVVVGLFVGPVLAVLIVRHPLRRSSLALGVTGMIAVVWTVVLMWPEPVPVWLVIVLVIALAIGGPASQIGFDFARTFNPASRLGSANGIVNVGGFTASFVMMLLIGIALDLQARGGAADSAAVYSLDAFKLAMLVQFPVVGIGVVALLVERRRTRRLLLQEEGIQVGPLWVALAMRFRRRRA